MKLEDIWKDATTWRSVWIGATGVLVFFPVSYVLRYRKSIKKRLKQIEDEMSKPLMTRGPYKKFTETSDNSQREIRLLELNPEYVEKHKGDWNLVSLGSYLNSLKPSLTGDSQEDSKLPKFIEVELETVMGTVLLRALGHRLGGAILPLLGVTDVHSRTTRIATAIASWWVSHFMVLAHQKQEEESDKNPNPVDHLLDKGKLRLNFNELSSFANLYEKLAPSKDAFDSLEYLRRGEIGFEPSFGRPLSPGKDEEAAGTNDETKEDEADLIHNPFIVSLHWDNAIEGMEKQIMERESMQIRETPNSEAVESTMKYDPEDRSFSEPTPVHERLLPDLYMGWGNAKCTHTKREIIRNRLFSVLFNKLSYNFYKKEQGDSDLFILKMTPGTYQHIWSPEDFLQALMDAGHKVEMCPKSNITTFGLALCVKENDGTFSNVPIGCFVQSGYERKDSRPAHYVLPHGGMDLSVIGPLVGKSSSGKSRRCNIQFYASAEGVTCWNSDHNPEVPWIQKVASTDFYSNDQVLRAMKLSGILAVTFNALATEMNLPLGGYGLNGVCSDCGGLLDFAVRGETNVFPLVSTGRFLIRSGRRLIQLYENIKDVGGQGFGDDIRRLIAAFCIIDSDLQASPANLRSSAKRFLASQPETLCFKLEQESKVIMTDLMQNFEKFDHWAG